MRGNDNKREPANMLAPSHSFMGASFGFRLGVVGICLVALWLCVGWAVSA